MTVLKVMMKVIRSQRTELMNVVIGFQCIVVEIKRMVIW